MTSPLAEQYRQERAQISASGIYRVPAPVNRRPSIYADTPAYSGLGSYTQGQRSKFLPRQGESDQAFVKRLAPLSQHLESLPADELAQVTEVYNGAVERLQGGSTHADLRQHLASRQGVGTGIMGNASAQERGAIVGSRFGGREPVAQGHVAHAALQTPGQPRMASASDINAILAQREAERMGREPERQQIQTGSSGTGWMVGR